MDLERTNRKLQEDLERCQRTIMDLEKESEQKIKQMQVSLSPPGDYVFTRVSVRVRPSVRPSRRVCGQQNSRNRCHDNSEIRHAHSLGAKDESLPQSYHVGLL